MITLCETYIRPRRKAEAVAHIALQFEPREVWIGVVWSVESDLATCYVCLLPLFPVRIAWWRTRARR